MESAEQVCSDKSLPRDNISFLLSDLVCKSLVAAVSTDQDSVRFHYLETVRVYANGRLRQAAERDVFQQRHLDHFVLLAEEADRQLSGANQKEWLERIDREYANFRKGLTIGVETDVPSGLRLGHGLSRYWEIRGSFCEATDWISILLSKTSDSDRTIGRARVLDSAGWFRHIIGDDERAAAFLEEGLAIFRELGDRVDASVTLIKLGFAIINRDGRVKTRALFEESSPSEGSWEISD